MKKVGFTIGKFAPFHKGHELLIQTALKEMDEVYVVVYDTDLINVNIETRANWIKKVFPRVKIIYAFDSPKQYGLDEESVNIQMKYLSNLVKDKNVTHFYSSELYGEKVADYLNIKNRIVNIDRDIIPIHASQIRSDLKNNSKYIEGFIYKDLLKNGE